MRNARKDRSLDRKGGASLAGSLEKTLTLFVEWMRGRSYATRTIQCYLFDTKHFVEWVRSQGLKSLQTLAPLHITRYQAVLATRPGRGGKPLTAQTRAHILAAILAFGKFLEETRIVKRDPTRDLTLPKVPRKLPDNVLTVRQMEKLLFVPSLEDPIGLRNRALMELLYATAIRQSEALYLGLDDVDLEASEARVREGKGGQSRIVPLCRETVSVLSAYLTDSRPKLVSRFDSKLFFVSNRGRKVDPSRMLKTLKRYARTAGIARAVGFHTFRHSCATHLLERGAGIRYIQELLGHHSLTSTQIYTKVSITDLKAAHAKFHPREKMDV